MGENQSKLCQTSLLGYKSRKSPEDIRRLRLQKFEGDQPEQHQEVDRNAFMSMSTSSFSQPVTYSELEYAKNKKASAQFNQSEAAENSHDYNLQRPVFQAVSIEPPQATSSQQNTPNPLTPDQSPLIRTNKNLIEEFVHPVSQVNDNTDRLIHSLLEDVYQFTLRRPPFIRDLSSSYSIILEILETRAWQFSPLKY